MPPARAPKRLGPRQMTSRWKITPRS